MKLANGEIIAIARGVKSDKIAAVGATLLRAGLKYMEVSLSDQEEAIACLKELSRQFGDDLGLGAGTVTRPDQADRALAAGAKYIITPGWDRELIKYIMGEKIPVFPGVFTPSEIMQALNEGLTQLKLFPAGNVSPSFIKNLKGPFPAAEFVGVGGINKENIRDYYKAGCFSFAIGSDLIPKLADESALPRIEKSAQEYVSIMKELSANEV